MKGALEGEKEKQNWNNLAACRTNIKTLSIHQLDGSLVIDCREAKDLLNFKRLLNKEQR